MLALGAIRHVSSSRELVRGGFGCVLGGPLCCLKTVMIEDSMTPQHGRKSVAAVPVELINPLDPWSTTRASLGRSRMMARLQVKMGIKNPMSWDILIKEGTWLVAQRVEALQLE